MENLIINIQNLNENLALSYGLDIKLFLAICLLSLLFLYVGYYLMVYGTTRKITWKDFLILNIKSRVSWNTSFISGAFIHLIAKISPYLYIIFFTKNLPVTVLIVLWIIILFSILFFISRLIPHQHKLPESLEILSYETIDNPQESEILWEIYDDTFKSLNKESPCRQSFDKDHFLLVLLDQQVKKYVLRKKDGEILGVAIVANTFRSLPWISEDYFKENFPKEYEEKMIYYFAGLAIKNEYRGNKYSLSLLEYIVSDLPRGIIMGFDHSRNINPGLHHFTKIIKQARLIKRTHIEQQHYHIVNWKKKI